MYRKETKPLAQAEIRGGSPNMTYSPGARKKSSKTVMVCSLFVSKMDYIRFGLPNLSRNN
jgi:hypothetical protein